MENTVTEQPRLLVILNRLREISADLQAKSEAHYSLTQKLVTVPRTASVSEDIEKSPELSINLLDSIDGELNKLQSSIFFYDSINNKLESVVGN